MSHGTTGIDTVLFETAATASKPAGPAREASVIAVDGTGRLDEQPSSLTLIDPHVLYDSKTGALYYDIDGSGLQAMIQIAVIGASPSRDVPDFEVL